MRGKLITILTVLMMVAGNAGVLAADGGITLEQAKSLAKANSRNITKYEINEQKAKYQLDQVESQRNNTLSSYNSLSARYDSLSQEYNELQVQLDAGDLSVVSRMTEIEGLMDDIEASWDNQYTKVTQSSNSIQTAENRYSDSTKDRENYAKQLEYNVEDLYFSILTQEEALQILNKQYELSQIQLKNENIKYTLGRTSQSKIEQLKTENSKLNKKLIEQNNSLQTAQGKMNQLMGFEYNANLQLAPFAIKAEFEIPESSLLLFRAQQNSNSLSVLNRDINQSQSDQDNTSDYYEYVLLGLDIKEKKLQLEDEKQKLNETVDKLISDIKGKKEDYQLAIINLNTAQKSYEWDQKRFEFGLISKIELMQSEINYLNMKNNKLSSGYSLHLAEHSLKLAQDGIL